jgi:hypothetical protein
MHTRLPLPPPTIRCPASPQQSMAPEKALKTLANAGANDHHYHHMPILVLFGGLSLRQFLQHNATAMLGAADIAKANLQHCVVGNTEDLVGSTVRL